MSIVRVPGVLERKGSVKSLRGYFCFQALHKTRPTIMIENLGVQSWEDGLITKDMLEFTQRISLPMNLRGTKKDRLFGIYIKHSSGKDQSIVSLPGTWGD